jgi:hypothetical protein
MTPGERIEEIASILTIAIIRSRLKKLRKNRDNSLDCSADTSVYAPREEAKNHA